MGDYLNRGALGDWAEGAEANTMAKAIETALQSFFGPFPPGDPTERRKFCLAIAHGVIDHLNQNPTAFRVRINVGGTNYDGSVVNIQRT